MVDNLFWALYLPSLLFSNWTVSMRDESKPRELVIELTTSCNYSCIHCFRFAVRDFNMSCFMSRDVFNRIIDEALAIGVSKLVFTGFGEPTIHPLFLEFISYVKSLGFYTVINTNGSRLEELSEYFIKIGIDEVYVSIDAYDVKLYKQIRRPGSLTDVTRGLIKLKDAKLKYGTIKPIVKSIFTVNRLNVREVSKAVEYAKDLGISEVMYSYYIPYIGGDQWIDCFSSDECRQSLTIELRNAIGKILESGVKVTKPNIKPSTLRSCPFASNKALYIRCDGLVSPCIYYSRSWKTVIDGIERDIREYIVGDTMKDNLIEIWRRNYKLLFNLDFKNIPSCLDCELRSVCYHTMSNEYDCLGNTPSCAHCPYLHLLSYCPI